MNKKGVENLPDVKHLKQALDNLINQDSQQDHEKAWLIEHMDNENARNVINKLSTRDLHVIAEIYQSQPMQVKRLPDKLKLSQPTISRAINKLAGMNVLSRYKATHNGKEIIVNLTSLGNKIAEIHAQLELHINHRLTQALAKYSSEEINQVTEVLQKLSKV
ncbi:hypothetical protein FD06_GL000663 [Apilactobacillus ozensis DSM 23829 = JCM 17196]|uniref:HTH marR-type domain-containing protein n=1 Tax=Apilactobacillus ozensis DSM 23829 = JCM 17196 TaxID=1423781 RepID=A0A0R2AJP3_9LACO|nr:hypothetical protein FD06_GL000663 [Apilactobacillus ozensis DSM 23829 = JCM 17196]